MARGPLVALPMSKMFKIALPDGSFREVPEGSTPGDVAAAIGPGLAKSIHLGTRRGEDATDYIAGFLALAAQVQPAAE